jgi:hypothetical protein
MTGEEAIEMTRNEPKEEKKFQTFRKLEKFRDPIDVSQRRSVQFSDELKLSKAKIYKCLGPFDDRLQVLPIALVTIEPEEYKNLPRYPALIKGQVVTGRSIDEFDIDQADSVWIVSTPDFQLGYVVGRCNNFGDNTDTKWPYSYQFNSVKDFLYGRSAVPEDFDYKHFDVRMMVMTSKGGSIEMINHQTGDWIMFNTSGSIITVQQKKVYMRVGSPPDPPESGPAAFSAITITTDKIHCKTPNFEIDAKDVILGHHNLELLGCTGGAVMGKNGVSGMTVSSIHV